DGARRERLFDLLGEQTLAADIRQRPVLDAITAGADRLNGDLLGIEAMRLGQRLPHHVGLGKRKRTAARTKPQDVAGGLRHGASRLSWERGNKTPCLYSESRPHATRPPPRSSSAPAMGWARSCPISCCRRSPSMPRSAAWCRRSPRALMSRRSTASSARPRRNPARPFARSTASPPRQGPA